VKKYFSPIFQISRESFSPIFWKRTKLKRKKGKPFVSQMERFRLRGFLNEEKKHSLERRHLKRTVKMNKSLVRLYNKYGSTLKMLKLLSEIEHKTDSIL